MPAQHDRPNILWICSDSQRYDTIGALGNPHIHTPHLDSLAADGVAFSHAFCQCPICTPSRASFLTGMYPSTIHACTNGNDVWSGAAPLAGRLLADAGYDTGLAGKLHIAGTSGRVEPRADDGYRVFEWSHHPRNDWGQSNTYSQWLRGQGVDPEITRTSPETISPRLHQTMWCAERAIAFMEEQRDRPWLMSVNTFDPHPPFDPPEEYLRRYDPQTLPPPLFRESDLASQELLKSMDYPTTAQRPEELDAPQIKAAYYAMISLIDDAVGRMLDSLQRSGQRERTIVVYCSDHGEMLGDHGLTHKGCRFYEGLVRVPLLISWPGVFKSGLVGDALVELIDIMPTLLQACGLPIPQRMQGRSLLPILTGAGDAHHHRESVRGEFYHVINPDAYEPRGRYEGTYATMLRDRRHKLVVYHGHETGELFDLEGDPGEFDNLWHEPAAAAVRCEMMKKSFDGLAFAVDIGPKQVTRF